MSDFRLATNTVRDLNDPSTLLLLSIGKSRCLRRVLTLASSESRFARLLQLSVLPSDRQDSGLSGSLTTRQSARKSVA